MLSPDLCESCNERTPTVFVTYRVARREIKVALCERCSTNEIREGVLNAKIAHLPPEEGHTESEKTTIFVVVQVENDDDHDGFPSARIPIAAFLRHENADQFIADKRTEDYLYLDWEIVAIPVEDLDSASRMA